MYILAAPTRGEGDHVPDITVGFEQVGLTDCVGAIDGSYPHKVQMGLSTESYFHYPS